MDSRNLKAKRGKTPMIFNTGTLIFVPLHDQTEVIRFRKKIQLKISQKISFILVSCKTKNRRTCRVFPSLDVRVFMSE